MKGKRDQNGLVYLRNLKHLLVGAVRFDLGYVKDIVTVLAKALDQRPIDISVTQEPQAASSGAG